MKKEVISEIEVYSDLVKLWFVEDTRKKDEKLSSLYSFFWVSSLKNIKEIFNIPKMWINFKKSTTLTLNEYNLSCWLKLEN